MFASSFANASSADIRAAVMHHAYTHEHPPPQVYPFYWLYWYKSTNTDAAHPHPPPQVPFLAFTGEKDWIAASKMTTAFFDAPGGCGGAY